jgi:polysaccharide pyruvyl transferase WcaK-like protein
MYKSVFEKGDLRNRILGLIYIKYKRLFKQRASRYEDFIANRLNVTKEYSSAEELKSIGPYDVYVSGSDQIWNLKCYDFDWSNYLEFAKNLNRISYAASFGPKSYEWNTEERKRIRQDLLKYAHISVREEGSAKAVNDLVGIEPNIHVDPTLLIDAKKWEKIASTQRATKKEYILLYDLKQNKNAYKIAHTLSRVYRLPVVVIKENAKMLIRYPSFIKRYDAGPEEFLGYIKNAKIVVSSSFHGTVFSIIFRKPFFAVDGLKDLRISTLLNRTSLEERSVSNDDYKRKIMNAYNIDFSNVDAYLKRERERSLRFLTEGMKNDI